MSTNSTISRVHFLDAARATMLLLGIPFHVSEIYRVSGHFSLSSDDTSYVASLISALIHSFRMPAFFLLSGYFAAMLIERQGSSRWLKARYLKLGIPLVATTLTLGFFEEILATYYAGQGSLADAMREVLSGSVLTWVRARWFLITLILYCTTLVALHRQIPLIVRQSPRWTATPVARRNLMVVGMIALIVIPFAAIVAGKVAGQWIISSPELKSYAINYVKYIAFFGIGVGLFYVPEGMSRFVKLSRFDVVMLMTTLSIYLVTYFAFYGPSFPTEHPQINKAFGLTWTGIEVLTGYFVAKGFFALMSRLFTRESPTVAYFVDASFCIYLVHEIFFLLAGGALLNVGWPPLLEMMIICVFTLLGAVGVYEIARRVSILAWPLNGGPFRYSTAAR